MRFRVIRRRFGALLTLAAVAAWAQGAWAQSATDAEQADEATTVRVAILPFVVHSGESPEYLRAGLADMLNARLAQVAGLEAVRIEDESKATTRINRALVVGRDAEVDFVMFGSFTRFGEGASLDVQLAAIRQGGNAPLREIYVHSGSIGDVIPDLDELVGKVTRFVIRDYVTRDAAAPTLALSEAAEERHTLETLRRRVEYLEETVRALQSEEGAPSLSQLGEPPATAIP